MEHLILLCINKNGFLSSFKAVSMHGPLLKLLVSGVMITGASFFVTLLTLSPKSYVCFLIDFEFIDLYHTTITIQKDAYYLG